jgi:hypothetical protein
MDHFTESPIIRMILDGLIVTAPANSLVANASFDLPERTLITTPAQTSAVDRALTHDLTVIQGSPEGAKIAVIAALGYAFLSNPTLIEEQQLGQLGLNWEQQLGLINEKL